MKSRRVVHIVNRGHGGSAAAALGGGGGEQAARRHPPVAANASANSAANECAAENAAHICPWLAICKLFKARRNTPKSSADGCAAASVGTEILRMSQRPPQRGQRNSHDLALIAIIGYSTLMSVDPALIASLSSIFSNWTPAEAFFLSQAAFVGLLFTASPLPDFIGQWLEEWAERVINVSDSLETGSTPSARDPRA